MTLSHSQFQTRDAPICVDQQHIVNGLMPKSGQNASRAMNRLVDLQDSPMVGLSWFDLFRLTAYLHSSHDPSNISRDGLPRPVNVGVSAGFYGDRVYSSGSQSVCTITLSEYLVTLFIVALHPPHRTCGQPWRRSILGTRLLMSFQTRGKCGLGSQVVGRRVWGSWPS